MDKTTLINRLTAIAQLYCDNQFANRPAHHEPLAMAKAINALVEELLDETDDDWED